MGTAEGHGASQQHQVVSRWWTDANPVGFRGRARPNSCIRAWSFVTCRLRASLSTVLLPLPPPLLPLAPGVLGPSSHRESSSLKMGLFAAAGTGFAVAQQVLLAVTLVSSSSSSCPAAAASCPAVAASWEAWAASFTKAYHYQQVH